MNSNEALEFCLTSPNAVILTLWPSGGKECVDMAKTYLKDCAAELLFDKTIEFIRESAEHVVRALYHGEEWLESNCWYHEQPLKTGPPDGPYAGAKWKKELCFKNKNDSSANYILHIFVVNAKNAASLWQRKYSTRAAMARKTGNPGNSCMHITDSQKNVLSQRGNFLEDEYACDDSYAFHCARALLDENSIFFLNTVCTKNRNIDQLWEKYTSWLSHPVKHSVPFPTEILQID